MAQSIATTEFTSPINRETTYSNERIGYGKSTLELFKHSEGEYTIEWCYLVGTDNEDSVGIGIWCDNKKIVEDYDGVFELPKEVIDFLKENGFTTDNVE